MTYIRTRLRVNSLSLAKHPQSTPIQTSHSQHTDKVSSNENVKSKDYQLIMSCIASHKTKIEISYTAYPKWN